MGVLRSFARISAPKYVSNPIATASMPSPPNTIQRFRELCAGRRDCMREVMASLTTEARSVFRQQSGFGLEWDRLPIFPFIVYHS